MRLRTLLPKIRSSMTRPAVFECFEDLHFADMRYLMNLMYFESNLHFIQNVGMVQI